MNCPDCEFKNPEDAKFCGKCRAKLLKACPQCGRENSPANIYCNECGHDLKSATQDTPIDYSQPQSYTPKHLADKILQSKSALEGERKQVTVLFADVKGSMELAEQVDPEEWHRILDRFFQILADGVHRFEGTVNQYTGDGIMALFGAPIAHEDHAQRACYAALHLREELTRYADELRRSGLNFSTRMGLNSGEVVVGKIGDDLRMDYTAQGQTVGLAQRMEQRAAPDTAYLSASTARLVEGFFKLRDLGEFDLKGMASPVRAHELVAAGPIWTRLQAARSRGLSRFVGRVDEMAILDLALHRATEGNGQVVGIVGEAGVGKSRLCLEFVEGCRAKGIRVFEAHCPAHGRTVSLLPFLDLLRHLLGVSGHDHAQQVREAIAGRLILLDREFEATLPLVFEFLGVADPEHVAPALDPEARQRQLFTFTRRLVAAMSAQEPLVLLVDDLQWIDPASDDFLDQIADSVGDSHALLLVNFRPEYEASWMRRPHYQQVPLLPLGPEEIVELLRRLLGRDPSVAPLIERIGARTRGNPFFIEEVVQSLAEVGSLEGVQGGYRLTALVEEVAVPASVQSVLAARIDRLDELAKRVLQTASVIGKRFSELLLKRVAGLPEADLMSAIGALRDAEFLYEEALYPEVEYGFKHPLTHEVALQSQLRDRRSRTHASVAEAIEQLHTEKLGENAALLAHHWEEAGDRLLAARWHRRAAEWTGTHAAARTQEHWQKVRSLIGGVTDSTESVELGAQACMQLLNLGWRTGLTAEEARALLAEGRGLAEQVGDSELVGHLLAAFGVSMFHGGSLEESYEPLQTAVALAETLGDPKLVAIYCSCLIDVHFYQGSLAMALALCDKVAESVRDDPGYGTEVWGFGTYEWTLARRGTWVLVSMGRIDEGLAEHRRALELVRQRGDREALGYIHSNCLTLADWTDDASVTLHHARQGLEIAEEHGTPNAVVYSQMAVGAACLANSDAEQAIEVLRASLALTRERRVGRQWEPWTLTRLARAYLSLGDPRQARAMALEALDTASSMGTLFWEAEGHLVLARVLRASAGMAERAAIDSALSRAQDLIESTGGRSLLPLVHEERAALAALDREKATAEQHLRDAHRLFAEMGATGHAQRLAMELGI